MIVKALSRVGVVGPQGCWAPCVSARSHAIAEGADNERSMIITRTSRGSVSDFLLIVFPFEILACLHFVSA